MICKPTSATDKLSDMPEMDFCMLGVKSYDLDSTLFQIQNKITGKTTILPLLNGVDIYERIRRRIKTGVVFPSCVYVSARIERSGKVTQRGGLRTIVFGKDPHKDMVDERIFDLFTQAGHFGLVGMQERATRLGGTLQIHTAPEEGTRITVQLPDQLAAA